VCISIDFRQIEKDKEKLQQRLAQETQKKGINLNEQDVFTKPFLTIC